MSTGSRTALIAGSTGLVGGECLAQLVRHPAYGRVTALTRRPAEQLVDGEKVRQVQVEFDRLEEARESLAADHVFCALGTTIRKAGSQDNFRRVDHDYVVRLAEVAKEQGARHLLLVSAIGADPGSRVFYNRVKGEAEEAVKRLPYHGITILRPSLLLGPRREFRPGELVGKLLGVLAPPRWRPVHARDVAAAMIDAALGERPGVQVLESREIRSR